MKKTKTVKSAFGKEPSEMDMMQTKLETTDHELYLVRNRYDCFMSEYKEFQLEAEKIYNSFQAIYTQIADFNLKHYDFIRRYVHRQP